MDTLPVSQRVDTDRISPLRILTSPAIRMQSDADTPSLSLSCSYDLTDTYPHGVTQLHATEQCVEDDARTNAEAIDQLDALATSLMQYGASTSHWEAMTQARPPYVLDPGSSFSEESYLQYWQSICGANL